MDYTNCLTDATTEFTGKDGYEWRRVGSQQCQLRFDLEKMEGPVFLYYSLTNFYQNHRLYVKSLESKQLKGEALTFSQLSNCEPLVAPEPPQIDPITGNRIVYYPCGLIANSQFNDTISGLQSVTRNYTWQQDDISWSADQDRYGASEYGVSWVAPPPYWTSRVQGGKELIKDGKWLELPNLNADQHFQVWMRTAGLPSFRKLYGKTESTIEADEYVITIDSTFDVKDFGGTKSVVISTISWLGGKNSFLGIAYIVVGAVSLFLGFAFLVRHLISPRKLGDHQYLSWNQ